MLDRLIPFSYSNICCLYFIFQPLLDSIVPISQKQISQCKHWKLFLPLSNIPLWRKDQVTSLGCILIFSQLSPCSQCLHSQGDAEHWKKETGKGYGKEGVKNEGKETRKAYMPPGHYWFFVAIILFMCSQALPAKATIWPREKRTDFPL